MNPVEVEILINSATVAPVEPVEDPDSLFELELLIDNDYYKRVGVRKLGDAANYAEISQVGWTVAAKPEWLKLEPIQGHPDRHAMTGYEAPSETEPFVLQCEIYLRDTRVPDRVFSARISGQYHIQGVAPRWPAIYPPPGHHLLTQGVPQESGLLDDMQLKRIVRTQVEHFNRFRGWRHRIHHMLAFATALHQDLSGIAEDQPYVATITAVLGGSWASRPSDWDVTVSSANSRYDEVVGTITNLLQWTSPAQIGLSDPQTVYDETKRLVEHLEVLQDQVTKLHAGMLSLQSGFIAGSDGAVFALDFVKGTCFAIFGAVGGAALGGGVAAAAAVSFVGKLLETSAEAGGKAWAGTKVPDTWEIFWEAIKAAAVSVAGKLLEDRFLKPLAGWFVAKTDATVWLSGVSDATRAYIIELAIADFPKTIFEEILKSAIKALEVKYMGQKPSQNSFFGEVAKGLVQGKMGDKVKGRVTEEFVEATFDESKFATKFAQAIAKIR